jgi:RNA polymerase sigma factor (sigma-70 family)
MKIGARISLFNARMRELREAQDLTQADLARYLGVGVQKIGLIEGLKQPFGDYSDSYQLLCSIADFFDVPLHELFPPDYLYALEQKYLLRNKPKAVVIHEIDMSQFMLPESGRYYLTDNTADYGILKEEIAKALDNLSERDRNIMLDRYGFNGEPLKLEEAGEKYGVSRERIRQIEENTLSYLRHPRTRRTFRDFYYGIDWDAL